MNKEKRKHLPFNFFWCWTSWFVPFAICASLVKLDIWISILISTYVYLTDVFNTTDKDYLEERIKELEDQNKTNA